MNRHAEQILRDSVERVLEHHDKSYVISDTRDGFTVHLPNQPLMYQFSYHSEKGWLMNVVLKNVNETNELREILSEQHHLSSIVKQCNVRYVLYKQKPKNKLLQQKKEIDAFFSRYQELLRERRVEEDALRYDFHPIGSLQPYVAVRFSKKYSCWVISYSDFNEGEALHPVLEELYDESQRLVFNLNKQNL